jgi:hypothetical protein
MNGGIIQNKDKMDKFSFFKKNKPLFEPNVFIGGEYTKEYIAGQLAVNLSDIKSFKSLNNNTEFYIGVNYEIVNAKFYGNISLDYFLDVSEKCTILGRGANDRSFRFNIIKKFIFNSATQIATRVAEDITPDCIYEAENVKTLIGYAFYGSRKGVGRVNIRNADTIETIYGLSLNNDQTFRYYGIDGILTSNPNVFYMSDAIETLNNGVPPRSVSDMINKGADVRFISISDQDNTPESISDLDFVSSNSNSITVNFSDIQDADFYEVWIKDFSDPKNVLNKHSQFGEITNQDKVIKGLKNFTTYEVRLKAVDYYYNKGNFSNTILAQTTI